MQDDDTNPDEPVAEVRGINVYAKQCVDGRDRRRVERLARYITRPRVAQDRLSRRADGRRLELAFKSVWKDGTRALVLAPHDLISRLVAAVPPPRFHTLRYFGVLSSHASLRSEVVPQRESVKDDGSVSPPAAPGDQLDLELTPDADSPPAPPRRRWAWLLAHVFQADLEHCPRCGGPMRWGDVATTEDAAARLMAKHGLAPQPPPAPRLPPLGQLELPLS